jgi:flavin reductase (DIM6/NTAB) family NADH-FMN oxidoreductase RutF
MTAVPQPGQLFRRVLGHFPTGVVIVTAIDDGTPVGMAIGSFTSVSLDPPLIAILPAKTSVSWPRIAAAGAFCVNVLNARQEALCRTFATTGADKFAGVPWQPSPSGAPALTGALAWIDCSLEQLVEAGDHYIALGRVRALDVSADQGTEPLVFFKGGYGTIRR